MLKKALITCLLFMFTLTSVLAATTVKKTKSPYTTKIVEVTTKDNHIMRAKLQYPKPPKGVKVTYPTIIMLHSLGYCSSQWGALPEELLKLGYAVLMVDLRGHGISNKDTKFRLKSWTYFTNTTYQKYPSDVLAIINQTKITNKRVSFSDYSIIGGDIGANTAVLVAKKMHPKPKSMVLLTPTVDTKGLTIATLKGIAPLSEVGNGPILVMCSQHDKYSINQEMLLKKFARGEFIINNVDVNKNGMMIVRNNEKAMKSVIEFINDNMKPKSSETKNNIKKQ